MCAWVCPKEECPNKNSLKKGDKCPACGAEAKEFGFFDLKLLLEVKDKLRENFSREPKGKNEILAFFTGGDEVFRSPVKKELHKIPQQNGYPDQETTSLENMPTVEPATINLLKSIFEQNKIIIQQNELIYKLLKKNRKMNSAL